MARLTAVTGVELAPPQIQQRQGLLAIPHLIAQVIRDAAVGIDAVEMRPQPDGQKPRGHMKVLVVRGGQPLAVGTRLFQGRTLLGDAVFRRQRGPTALYQFPIVLSTLDCHSSSLSSKSFLRARRLPHQPGSPTGSIALYRDDVGEGALGFSPFPDETL
jgi:hypothetical protein